MALIIVMQNISDLADVSDYRYEVLIGDGTSERSKVIAAGKLEGHARVDGWKALLSQLVKEAE